jgi:hypothetical protein
MLRSSGAPAVVGRAAQVESKKHTQEDREMRSLLLIVPLAFFACSKESRAYERDTNPDTPATRTPDTRVPDTRPIDASAAADQSTTERVRKELQADTTLSADAKSVVISTKGGVVTLTGSVPTEAEKTAVATKVGAVSGVSSVVNQLTVENKNR